MFFLLCSYLTFCCESSLIKEQILLTYNLDLVRNVPFQFLCRIGHRSQKGEIDILHKFLRELFKYAANIHGGSLNSMCLFTCGFLSIDTLESFWRFVAIKKNNISVAYFVVRIEYVVHVTYEICVNPDIQVIIMVSSQQQATNS